MIIFSGMINKPYNSGLFLFIEVFRKLNIVGFSGLMVYSFLEEFEIGVLGLKAHIILIKSPL